MTRLRRVLFGLAAATALFAVAALLWLLRDPEAIFVARRGALTQVEERATTVVVPTLAQDVRLTASSGLAVELAIRRPAAAEHADSIVRRRLFLILGGHARGKAAGELLPDTHGHVFAFLEYPYDGDHRANGLAALAQVPAIRRAFYDTPPAIHLALDYLLQRPDVDTARVELVGASFGAPFATIAAARDARVTRLWLVHGGGDPYALIEQGLKKDVAFTPARAGLAGLATLLISGPRFAPERWIARIAPRPVVMLNAEDDERIPRRSVDLLYEAAREPKELIWLPGRHMQGNRPEVLERLLAEVLSRAEAPAAATASAPR